MQAEFLQVSRKAPIELRHLRSTERSSFTECLDEASAACRDRLFGGQVQHPIGPKVIMMSQISLKNEYA